MAPVSTGGKKRGGGNRSSLKMSGKDTRLGHIPEGGAGQASSDGQGGLGDNIPPARG